MGGEGCGRGRDQGGEGWKGRVGDGRGGGGGVHTVISFDHIHGKYCDNDILYSQ